MPQASAYKPEERIFAMHLGRSGSGKSVAAASYPKKYLNLDFDLRFAGIANAINKGLLNEEGIEYLQFSPLGGWEPLQKWCDQMALDRSMNTFQYKTIEVASVTSLARLNINYSKSLTTGLKIGIKRVTGPNDYKAESQWTHDVCDYLRTFPCNIIVSGHIINKWGREKDAEDYTPSEVIGEKLSLTDNLAENLLTYFNDVFRFSREIIKNEEKFFVEFTTDLAKNSYGIPPGKYDITNKQFYPFLIELIQKCKGKKFPIQVGDKNILETRRK